MLKKLLTTQREDLSRCGTFLDDGLAGSSSDWAGGQGWADYVGGQGRAGIAGVDHCLLQKQQRPPCSAPQDGRGWVPSPSWKCITQPFFATSFPSTVLAKHYVHVN